MSDLNIAPVQLDFRNTEKEYLAATRLYFWRSGELVARVVISYLLFGAGVLMLPLLFDFLIPFWALFALVVIGGVGWYHGFVIDLPRRYFRGDPKFRDEYHLKFTEAGVEFKTQHAAGSFDWSFYTGVIENESFYLMRYGKGLHSISIIPKRAFRDREQEITFRELLRRHVDHTLKLSDGDHEKKEYIPKSLEPPDWR